MLLDMFVLYSPNNMIHIYFLEDPRLTGDAACRYVGKTVNPKRRLRIHKSRAKTGRTHLCNGIRKMLGEGAPPVMRIIESFSTDDQACTAEIFWIKEMKSRGCCLWNSTGGGEGSLGFQLSKESRTKASASRLGAKNPFYGKHHTSTTKETISKSRTGEKNPMFGRPAPNKGKQHTQETKNKLSESHKGIHAGEKHPHAKLTWDDVKQIRACFKLGTKVSELSERFSVSRNNIYSILSESTWKIA